MGAKTLTFPAAHAQVAAGNFFLGDVWEANLFGVTPLSHDRNWSLTFNDITQPWLKDACKNFIKYSATTRSFSSLKAYIVSVRMFSQFLTQYGTAATPEILSRETIVEYIQYLGSRGGSAITRHQRLTLLRTFLETSTINRWLDVPPFLIRPEDLPRTQKAAPRDIPEEVMTQLNVNLEHLPEPIMRMVLVLQETGLRIGELCSLRFSCIEQDARGDWFLRYTDWKMRRKDRLKPVSRELVRVVQEQQEYIRQHLGEGFDYLFCGNHVGNSGYRHRLKMHFQPVPKTMSRQRFPQYLQRLARDQGIKDVSGKIWHFQSHQFRHTVGTRMINSGIPPHIIQRYLGHDSPEMTMRYAHIHDDTMRKALGDYLGARVIDITGRVVQTSAEVDEDGELQWLKRNVLAQALPNGSCARPIAKGPCPHANACLTCGDFRTTAEFLPQHRVQLTETEAIIAKAESSGWQRQAEMNRQVRSNILRVIQSLEAKHA